MSLQTGRGDREKDAVSGVPDALTALALAASLVFALVFSGSLPVGTRLTVGGLICPLSPGGGNDTGSGDGLPILIRLADIEPDVDPGIIIKLIGAEDPEDRLLTGGEPTVLIYHTHDTEAYRPDGEDAYEPSGNFRTEDDAQNVFAVGEELKNRLEEYGIIAVHAAEKHEKPLINSAYERSIETMRRYKEMYPSLVLFIDLHRDGVADTGYEDDFVTVDGLECARMMFVVGTGSSGKSSQYAEDPAEDEEPETPDFEGNYALARALTEALLSYDPGLARKIRVKAGNYNQQAGPRCLLVEVGHNGNTLAQAKNAMKYLAKAIAEQKNG